MVFCRLLSNKRATWVCSAPDAINLARESTGEATGTAASMAQAGMLPSLAALSVRDEADVGMNAREAALARIEALQKRQKQARALQMQDARRSTTPIAILMLSKSERGPPNLHVWAKWLAETGRKGSKIFIHGKHPWQPPPE